MATMNVSLPDTLRDWVEEQVKGGKYANTSDYIRDLIRHDQDRQDKRRALIEALIEGENSGVSTRSVPEILEDIRREHAGSGGG